MGLEQREIGDIPRFKLFLSEVERGRNDFESREELLVALKSEIGSLNFGHKAQSFRCHAQFRRFKLFLCDFPCGSAWAADRRDNT